ncbi:MAG: hypothetical protein OSA99_09330 [Acidimicrobiales bacterium]|nr:hypothetical protein [Acidimicrobiales bacterium]
MIDPDPGSTTRWTWMFLGAVAVIGSTILIGFEHACSWYHFAGAADALVAWDESGGGLALYRANPQFQFGPLAVLAALAFRTLPDPIEVWSVMVVGSLAGLACLAALDVTVRRRNPDRSLPRSGLLAAGVGLAFLFVWMRLSAYSTHIDDVIALGSIVTAGVLIDRRRSGWAVVALVAAAAAKPWAVIFAPLAALVPGRLRWARPLVVGTLGAATWLPFLVGASGTLEAISGFAVEVDANSGLMALGFMDAVTPGWLRPLQLAGGLVITAAVVWRRHSWPAAFAAGICARLIVDPATHHYYTAGFVLAVLAWELDRRPHRIPWCAIAGAIVLELAASDITLAGFMPYLRLATLGSVIVATLVRPAADALERTVTPNVARSTASRGPAVFSVSSGTGS